MTFDNVPNLNTTNNDIRLLINYINILIGKIREYSAENDLLIGNLEDISMESTKLVTIKTSSGRDFVGLKDGTLVGVL